MIARKYCKKIDVFGTVSTPDGYGGNTVAKQDIGTYWAEVHQLSSNKDNTLGKADLKITYSFKIRATNSNLFTDVDNLSIYYLGTNKVYNVTQVEYEDDLRRFVKLIGNG